MNILQELRLLLRELFQKHRLDEEMDQEMHSHIDLQIEENIDAGMSPEKARRAALRQFGWTESIKETCRDQRGFMWAENLDRDLCYATKMLYKSPGIAVLTLTLGIGLNVVLLTQLDDEFLRPRQWRSRLASV